MALFLSLVICVAFVTAAVSATNVTVVASCTSLVNDQCTQNLTSCLQPPCSLSCGRTSPQFSCSQDCVPSANLTDGYLCDALECQALQHCYQTCNNINCNSSTCTSNQCTQQLLLVVLSFVTQLWLRKETFHSQFPPLTETMHSYLPYWIQYSFISMFAILLSALLCQKFLKSGFEGP